MSAAGWASTLESGLSVVAQTFLTPVLVLVAGLFGYALWTVGATCCAAWQRRRGATGGFELKVRHAADPALTVDALEHLAWRQLQPLRLGAKVAPMLGLVATLIPMGPALKAVAGGTLDDAASRLAVAFAAVTVALIAASALHVAAQVRRRWHAADLRAIEADLAAGEPW